MIKPVEGPRGPHLFRASQSSADFTFDATMQMSPVLSKIVDEPARIENASSRGPLQTVLPPRVQTPEPKQFEPSRPGTIQFGMTSLESQDPSQWTIQQVAGYMARSDITHDIISKLQFHDISGEVLMHLQFDDLKELDITSFGKRHQLWSAIQALKGGEKGPSPVATPFQDITRPCSNVRSKSDGDIAYSPCSDDAISPNTTPISCSGHKKRRHHRKNKRHHNDPIEPGESVSIVAIEQVIPKPHECSKGEACPTWQKRERLLNAIRKEQSMGGTGWPVSPSRGGHIMITGNPGNPSTAQNLLTNVHRQQDEYRPSSEAVPSVVASSDLLGPGQLPEFALHEGMLQQLEQQDPQENVKHFLNFQHVTTGYVEEPPSPPLEMFPAEHHYAFHVRPEDIPRCESVPIGMNRPSKMHTAYNGPRHPPKLSLSIPRAASANPHLGNSKPSTPNDTFSPSRTVIASSESLRSPSCPPCRPLYKSRPGSELDVPLVVPTAPIARDNSQSVPPDMHYREPVTLQRTGSRAEWRRPSFAMPKLDEDTVFSTVTTVPPTTFPTSGLPSKQQSAAEKTQQLRTQFGQDISHAGWMKKRKTRLLRHDWQDAHFRLKGTVLDMHENARLSAALVDTIDVDEYSVTVSSLASNSKLSSALKSLKLSSNGPGSDKKKDGKAGGIGGAAFAFQLIPGEQRDRAKFATGKTHHFAVKSSNERIDWMRELMLAKAKKQKDDGYVVEHNGEKA